MAKRAIEYAATMCPPTTPTPKRKRKQTESLWRKWITERWLADRLGLDEDWFDWREKGHEVIAEPFAPEELPPFIQAKIEKDVRSGLKAKLEREIKENIKQDINDVNNLVQRLVGAGCCKPVVHFCLAQLSPEAERRRSKGELVTFLPSKKSRAGSDSPSAKAPFRVPGEELRTPASLDAGSLADDDKPFLMVRRPLATRDNVKEVAKAAMKAKGCVRKYERELWLVASAVEQMRRAPEEADAADPTEVAAAAAAAAAAEAVPRLPLWIVSSPELGEDPFALLQEFLAWLVNLVEAYTAPEQTKVLKSKGVLLLTAYVDLRVGASELRGRSKASLYDAVADLLDRMTDRTWSPSDLSDKLNKFKEDHKRLYKRLSKKLAELHDFHSAR